MPIFSPEEGSDWPTEETQPLIVLEEFGQSETDSTLEVHKLMDARSDKLDEIMVMLGAIKEDVEQIKRQKASIPSIVLKVTLLTIFMVCYYMIYLEERPLERVACLALQAFLLMGFYLVPSLTKKLRS